MVFQWKINADLLYFVGKSASATARRRLCGVMQATSCLLVKWRSWRQQGGKAPPCPERGRFPVRSVKQLRFFVRRKHRHFYVLYPARGSPRPLSIWVCPYGFVVGREDASKQMFVPYARADEGFLGQAIRQKRLFVLWDV